MTVPVVTYADLIGIGITIVVCLIISLSMAYQIGNMRGETKGYLAGYDAGQRQGEAQGLSDSNSRVRDLHDQVDAIFADAIQDVGGSHG